MAANVYYSVSPFGTGDIKTGSPTISISSGVATLSVGQTGNIGQGCRITYNTSSVCYISGVTDSTHFSVVTATGGTPSNVSGQTVNSIAHEYASLSAAEAGAGDSNHVNNTSLVTADVVLNLCCYYDHDDQTADTNTALFWGLTTDAARYVRVYTPTGGTQSINRQRHSGVWNDNKYRLVVSADYAFGVYTYTKLVAEGLQCKNTRASGGNALQIQSNTTVNLDSFIIVMPQTNIAISGIYVVGTGTVLFTNSIVQGGSASQSNAWGIYMAGENTLSAYNCISYCWNVGAIRTAGVLNLINCAIFNCEYDTWGSPTASYCASDSVYGTSAVDISPGATESTEWAKAFTDYANGDFSIKDTDSVLYDAGTDLSGTFTTDIIGTTRSSWDIGAFEYVAAGGGGASIIPRIAYYNRLLRGHA